LCEISKSRPQRQYEIVDQLESRKIVLCRAEPFRSGKGWMAGFQRDPRGAGAWLSRQWGRLGLPGLPRGPKPPGTTPSVTHAFPSPNRPRPK
jgi:hypothetical protein